MQTIVITGVSGFWGRGVAQRLLSIPDLHVIGLDQRPPAAELDGLDFIKADIRNPLLVELFRAEQVNTVVHLAWREQGRRREDDFESNVLGAMQLLGACADAGVQQFVWRSTTAVYGASAENPLYMPEETPLATHADSAFIQDALEVERFIASFAADYPAMRFATLRLANVIGADVDSPLNRLLRLPVWPDLLGFDPLFQVIDAEDAVAALAQAAMQPLAGPVNVAADGVVSLDQLAGKLGRPTLPILHLLVYWSRPLAASLPVSRQWLRWFPLEPDYLRYPWIGDLTRMSAEFGFIPRWSAAQAVQRMAETLRMRKYQPAAAKQPFAADHLDDVLARRGAARQTPAERADL